MLKLFLGLQQLNQLVYHFRCDLGGSFTVWMRTTERGGPFVLCRKGFSPSEKLSATVSPVKLSVASLR
ncbi:unnamed protein product [Brassica oleracea]